MFKPFYEKAHLVPVKKNKFKKTFSTKNDIGVL